MLKLNAVGYAATKDAHSIENLVAAGHGFYAHAANIPSSGHEVINQAQTTVSHIAQQGAELPKTIAVSVPSVVSSVQHNWMTHAIKVAFPVSEALPIVEGWL